MNHPLNLSQFLYYYIIVIKKKEGGRVVKKKYKQTKNLKGV